ncbi:MAG: transposase [Clostridia bacterium]|nr:transposase [Clostridia bacterium]
MSRIARVFSESGVYHILFRGVNQQNIFEEEADFEKLKETMVNVKQEMGFEIYAYCFMSNHVHIVLKEKNVGDISLIMKRILTKYARWYNIKCAIGDVPVFAHSSCLILYYMLKYLLRSVVYE